MVTRAMPTSIDAAHHRAVARKRRFRRHVCVGDGRCLFRAIAVHVHGDEARHVDVTEQVTRYIRTHREEIQPFLTVQVETFLHQLPVQWGGEEVLSVIPKLYDRDVIVMDRDHRRFQHYRATTRRHEPIIVEWCKSHYNAVLQCDCVHFDESTKSFSWLPSEPLPCRVPLRR